MEDWRRILADSVVKPKDLAERLGVDLEGYRRHRGGLPHAYHPDGAGHHQGERR